MVSWGLWAGFVQEGHRLYNCLLLKWGHLEEQRLQVGGGDREIFDKVLAAEVSLCSLPR